MTPQHIIIVFTSLILADIALCQNRPPFWQENLQAVLASGLSEDTERGAELGSLRATDPDEDRIRYYTESPAFFVDQNSGVVTLAASLDYESTKTVQAIFYASDTRGNRTPRVTYDVPILDANDNRPEFQNLPYNGQLSQNAQQAYVVLDDVVAIDRDEGRNAELDLICFVPAGDQTKEEACQKFSVEQQRLADGRYRAIISLQGALDFNVKNSYAITILARDHGTPSLERTAVVSVRVLDTTDTGPRFLGVPLSLIVYENTAAGQIVGEIRAKPKDSDLDSTNPLKITIKSDPQRLFSLDDALDAGDGVYKSVMKSTGIIDRETLGDTYVFTVEAVELQSGLETTSRAQTSIKVTIQDVNDMAPSFNQPSYEISIPEGLARSTQLPGLNIVVTDTDLATNALFELSIQGSASSIFSVSPTSGTGTVSVSMVIREPQFLDYEVPLYRQHVVTIVARETETVEQRSATAQVTINVQDINDNTPRFNQSDYTASVRENRPPGYYIGTFIAADRDSGDYGNVTYSISGGDSGKFRVDPQTGAMYLDAALDFETNVVLDFTYKATDGGGKSSAVPFRIRVLDYNDQGPKFTFDLYRTFVGESDTNMQPEITVEAIDIESDNDVTYRIQSGNTPDRAFTINSQTGHLLLTRPVGVEETPEGRGYFELIVAASDNGNPPRTSTVPVTVSVRDENNHGPIFQNSRHFKTIREDSPAGLRVLVLNATDADSGPNGQISYILHSGAKDNFQVDFYTGVIAVADTANLNIERFGKRYEMIVYAVDQGSPPRSSTATAIVTVTDVNNQVPRFTQDSYRVSVFDSVPVGTTVQVITASDPDSNAAIQYNIETDSITAKDKAGRPVTSIATFNYQTAFRIDSQSGAIETNGRLDREQVAEISFTVQAKDVNAETPPQQNGTALVIISIRSTRDDDLTFSPPWNPDNPEIRVTLPEEEPVGSLITTVVAHDPETGLTVTDYRKTLDSDMENYFVVNKQTGQVYLNRRMDYENVGTRQKSFQLEAFTPEPNARSAMATIIVKAIDINDHAPFFYQNEYIFSVTESLRYPSQIGTVGATDEDEGSFGVIRYSLSGQGADIFHIDPDTGVVTVAPNMTLDHEWIAEFNLIVQAEDNPDGPGTRRATSVPVKILMIDENDNTPKFDSTGYNFYTLEYVPAQSSLGRTEATDADSGTNGDVSYTIISGNPDDLFYIERRTGIIRSQLDLTDKARDLPYVLTVRASDNGNPRHFSDVIVNVFVTDMQSNDGRPRILQPPKDGYIVNVTEESDPGTEVFVVGGVDSDADPGDKLTYGFVPNEALNLDQSAFNIDPDTGRITVKARLDRETKDSYQVVVYVRDKDGKESTRKIVIHVSDTDDHRPSFENTDACPELTIERPTFASVKENEPRRTFVVQVQACDSDRPPNNKPFYFIVSGNNPVGASDRSPFSIEMTTGEVFTNVVLDREVKSRYTLLIFASNDANPNITRITSSSNRKRRATDPDIEASTLKVIIDITDVDDNKPVFQNFGDSGRVIAGVMAAAPPDSDVVQMVVIDADQDLDTTIFEVKDIKARDIYDIGIERDEVEEAFTISREHGMVRSNLKHYFDYTKGHFLMTVTAEDMEGNVGQTELLIYVIEANQRLRFIFEHPLTGENGMQQLYRTFVTQLMWQLPSGIAVTADSLHYHVDEDGTAQTHMTDMCFHMVKDNIVLNYEEAYMLIKSIRKSNSGTDLFNRYSVRDVTACEVKTTTMWWSGYWWLWWLLIALALAILFVSIILICVICYLWKRYRKYVRYEKPYVVLDPISVVPAFPEYEWQEQVVKMD